MNIPGIHRHKHNELLMVVSDLLERLRPKFTHLTDFVRSEEFFHKKFKKFAMESKVRKVLIDSAGLGGERLFQVSSLAETPEIKSRIKGAEQDKASFWHIMVLTQSGKFFICYVQYENWACRDESTGVTTLHATVFEAIETELSSFDLAQQAGPMLTPKSVGECIADSLQTLLR